MKWGFAGLGALLVGLLTLMGIFLFLDSTIVNEEDYYSLKETMEAAMYDAVDLDYYQRTGEIKIIQEKFVENFTRRFNENSVFANQGYTLEFYDIIESPPKASVRVYGSTNDYKLTLDSSDMTGYDIINEQNGILKYSANHLYTYEYYAVGGLNELNKGLVWGITFGNIHIPKEIADNDDQFASDKNASCQIVNIEYAGAMTTAADFKTYLEHYTKSKTTNGDYWYQGTGNVEDGAWMTRKGTIQYVEQVKNDSDVCQIETIEKFNPDLKNNVLNDTKVNLASGELNRGCKAAGIKYRITWECTS